MDDGCVRFLALYIQTASVRREIFPVKEIISWAINSVNSGQSWHDLCMRLILEWDKRITHKGMNIWEEMELKKIAEESSLNYSTSGAKYEEVVRSISRISCASLVAKYETQKEAKERFMKVKSAVDFVAESLR
jgi:leucyl aminopeptidase (aminopeptidase T)